MKYICLIRAETCSEGLPEAEKAALFDEYREYTASMRASGHWVAASRLQPADSAVTVRVRHGLTTTSDGPFAETKEQLGGFYLLEARDLNEAIQLAARIPGARYGSVEVRPVADDVATQRALGTG